MLRSLNSTLLAVSDNEKILSKGLDDMAKHINKQAGEVKKNVYGFILNAYCK